MEKDKLVVKEKYKMINDGNCWILESEKWNTVFKSYYQLLVRQIKERNQNLPDNSGTCAWNRIILRTRNLTSFQPCGNTVRRDYVNM